MRWKIILAAALAGLPVAGACALSGGTDTSTTPYETPAMIPDTTISTAHPGGTSVPTRPSPGPASTTSTVPAPTTGSSNDGGLPPPQSTGASVELCLNSRVSSHALSGNADNAQLGHVLWAAGKAPVIGSYRHIFVATPDGTYQYDPVGHSLSRRSDKAREQGAFVITYDSELPFDTGLSYMTALLSAVSLWDSDGTSVAACPKGNTLVFGVQRVAGLTDELAAHSTAPESSPGWLPDPSTDGDNRLINVLAGLKYTAVFNRADLTMQQVSQLLWAGYGCVPHHTYNERTGLTVPSAFASYYLTGKIYLANENGVYRYHNRNPAADLITRDHRLESIFEGDARNILRGEMGRLPPASCYMVLCLASGDVEREYALLETGFVAGNMLIQASAMGLGCNFQTMITPEEQGAIQKSLGIPAAHLPRVVVSIGLPAN